MEFKLSLEGDTFNALKTDFDQMLRHTLYRMEEQERDDAEITIKMKISLKEDFVPDNDVNSYAAERQIKRPSFHHKVVSEVKHKEEKAGGLFGDYELVWDKEKAEYVMRSFGGNQMSIFDKKIKDEEDAQSLEAEAKGLSAPTNIPRCFRVLGFTEIPTSEDVLNTRCRARLLEAHPDQGGSSEELEAVKKAVDEAREYLKNEAATGEKTEEAS